MSGCRHQYWDLGRCVDCFKTANQIDVEKQAVAKAREAGSADAAPTHADGEIQRLREQLEASVAECRRLQESATATTAGSFSDLATGVVGAWKENPLRKPVSERFMRHYYGASKGAERAGMNQNNRASADDLVSVVSETLVETERKLRVAEASLVRLREQVREKIADWRIHNTGTHLVNELEALLGEPGDGKTNGKA